MPTDRVRPKPVTLIENGWFIHMTATTCIENCHFLYMSPVTCIKKSGFACTSKYNPDIHNRRSIRLRGYDYSRSGAYFITICAYERTCLFGEIEKMSGDKSGECHSPLRGMVINEFGRIVQDEWLKSSKIRTEIELGAFVVMPNHFHGIVNIAAQPVVGAYGNTPNQKMGMRSPAKTIGAMVRGFKSAVTKRINETRKAPGVPVWQRNYYEHVIRNEVDYNRIAEYVATNPYRWIEDTLHPANGGKGTMGRKGNIGEDGDIVGAYGHTPLRNVPKPGGGDE